MKNKLQLVFLCLFLISISCTTEDPIEDIESNEKMSTEINTQQELNSINPNAIYFCSSHGSQIFLLHIKLGTTKLSR